MTERLYKRTPLIESVPISKRSGVGVLMKLENAQPTTTFKIRGISNLILKVLNKFKTYKETKDRHMLYIVEYTIRHLQDFSTV